MALFQGITLYLQDVLGLSTQNYVPYTFYYTPIAIIDI